MFNPVILGAVIVQSVISKGSPMAGAVAGYLITTGIAIWGSTVYASGNQVAFFGIPLTSSMFGLACVAWYVWDTKVLFSAHRAPAEEVAPAPEQQEVR